MAHGSRQDAVILSAGLPQGRCCMIFRITDHARASMAERGIDERALRPVLRRPDQIMPGNRPGREIRQGIALIGDPPFRVLLRAVIDRDISPPAVVTVYATIPFRRYGAQP
jgi:hypothetical protein